MLSASGLFAEEHYTDLKPDEQIVFYPTVAERVAGKTNLWRAQIRGCVFEVERRGLLVGAFRESLELKPEELTREESALFAARARLFLVDHERGKKVYIRFGASEFFVGTTGADGRFSGEVLLQAANADLQPPVQRNGIEQSNPAGLEAGVPFQAVLQPGEQRIFSDVVFPLEAEGVSVISDVDDTIKITEVRDRQATLRNTFLREFRAVPGMAEFYRSLARSNGASFHYLSASPWQLYEPLAQFIATNGFPAGTFDLKPFRWKNRSFFSLFASPEKYKPAVIEPLLKKFPGRKFILIGDSGERDPEVYGALARKFPGQILRIYIREVTGASAAASRYQKAFRDVPAAKWQIFREPREIKLPVH